MNSPLPPDPYNALGVSKDAPLSTIRSTYRKLVLTCHPDKVADEKAKAVKQEQFHQVQQAYEILSDDTKRKRYDDRVKLAELRAELMSEKKFKTPEYTSTPREYSRPAPAASYEMRGNAIYEERVPRQRSPDEDYLSAKYEDIHSVPRKNTERTEHTSWRRRSGQVPEDVRRSRARDYDYDEESILRERENERKTREQAEHAERRKRRDKDRRQDYETKRRYTRPEVISETESEYEETRERRRNPEPKRRHENGRSKTSSSRYQESESENDLESKHYRSAVNHIQNKEGRPTVIRYVTRDNLVPPVPPPPPPAPSQRYREEFVENPRRSSARSRSSRDEGRRDESRPKISREERRPSVIDISEARRPSLSSFTSEPGNIRLPTQDRHMPPRSATMETRSRSTKVPGVQRSATSPLASMVSPRFHSDTDRVKSSKARTTDIYDSPSAGSRSPSPPEYQTQPIKYRVSYNSSEDRGNARVLSVTPDNPSRSTREPSPHVKRPSISTRASSSARGMSSRSTSYAPEQLSVPVRPSVNRSETHHESHRSPLSASSRPKLPFEISYSPRISAKDAIYSSLPKSASASYHEHDRSHHGYESKSRPTPTRREPYHRQREPVY